MNKMLGRISLDEFRYNFPLQEKRKIDAIRNPQPKN